MLNQSKSIFALATAVGLVSGGPLDPEDSSRYPTMDLLMLAVGRDYQWQSYKVQTNDDYRLTLFRITGDAQGNTIANQGSRGPLLLQHGLLTDSSAWFHVSDPSKPALPIRLFEAGFDVWLGNNRGTYYSRDHQFFSADGDEAGDFWAFSHAEFGSQDVPAMVERIAKETQNCMRVSFVGHSLGNTQIFYGLGRGSYMQSYFSQVVALAPCFIPSVSYYFPSTMSEWSKTSYAALAAMIDLLKFESLFGPYWPDQMKLFCDFVGHRTSECAMMKLTPVGLIAGGNLAGLAEIGIQTMLHLAQLDIEQKFQYYESSYIINDLWGREGKEIELESIVEPPVRFIFIENDETCPIETNKLFAKRVTSYDTETTLSGRVHSYVVGDNDDDFFTMLMDNLQDAPRALSLDNCEALITGAY